jgi:hypothetical protein
VRAHGEILPAFAEAGADLRTLADLGYEDLADTVTVGFRRPKNGGPPLIQHQFNKAHNSLRAIGERSNSLLKISSKPCTTSASTGGGLGRSLLPRSSSSTSRKIAPHANRQ